MAQAKRAAEDMLERMRRAQSNSPEPRPLTAKTGGSANDFNDLMVLKPVRLSASPTFLQWAVPPKIGSRPPGDRRVEEAEEIGAVAAEPASVLTF